MQDRGVNGGEFFVEFRLDTVAVGHASTPASNPREAGGLV
jgi:hypothetical protein